jgi:hypothetical protein
MEAVLIVRWMAEGDPNTSTLGLFDCFILQLLPNRFLVLRSNDLLQRTLQLISLLWRRSSVGPYSLAKLFIFL